MQLARRLPGILAWGALALVACGSRTGLLISDSQGVEQPSTGPDAGSGAGGDAGSDPGRDAGADTGKIQVMPPPPPPPICADAGVQVFYVITTANDLVEFDPPSNSFRTLGTIACPNVMGNASPFSMAVDRNGNAYTIFGSGQLYELHPSARGVTCVPVPLSLGTTGVNSTFGMGFSGDSTGGGETLFIAGSRSPYVLATVPIPGFVAQPIGPLNGLVHPELTGNGAGDLYAFSGADCTTPMGCDPSQNDCVTCASSSIAKIEKTSGRILGLDVLGNLQQGNGWAFGFWGGVFYIFTAPPSAGGGSIVTRFDPATGSTETVNKYPEIIVGAGVSTCAPLASP